jgi:hypothetical protein
LSLQPTPIHSTYGAKQDVSSLRHLARMSAVQAMREKDERRRRGAKP